MAVADSVAATGVERFSRGFSVSDDDGVDVVDVCEVVVACDERELVGGCCCGDECVCGGELLVAVASSVCDESAVVRRVVGSRVLSNLTTPKRSPRYKLHRSKVVERRAVAALAKALTPDWKHEGLSYEVEEDGIAKKPELDGLVRIDSALLIMESKGVKYATIREATGARLTARLAKK